MFGFAALFMLTCFWGIIGLVWYLEGFWMALGVAAPFLLLYKWGGGWLDNWLDTSDPDHDTVHDPELNAFQQPLSSRSGRSRPKLPG